MRRTLRALAIVPFVFVFGGCGVVSVLAGNNPAASATSESPAADDNQDSSPDEAADADTDKPQKFGTTVAFDDGLEVTVSEPVKFKPSEYAAGADGEGTPLKFQITVKNGTDKNFDPGLIFASVMSGDAEAESIFDSGDSLSETPSTKIRPGKSVTWSVGFMVLDPKDVTMEVEPGSFDYDSVLFTNNP